MKPTCIVTQMWNNVILCHKMFIGDLKPQQIFSEKSCFFYWGWVVYISLSVVEHHENSVKPLLLFNLDI